MAVIRVNNDNFELEVLKSLKPVLVKFYSDDCAPCKMIIPTVNRIYQEYRDELKVVCVNTEENPALVLSYNICGKPTVVMFKNGKIVGKNEGNLQYDDLEDFVVQYLN